MREIDKFLHFAEREQSVLALFIAHEEDKIPWDREILEAYHILSDMWNQAGSEAVFNSTGTKT